MERVADNIPVKFLIDECGRCRWSTDLSEGILYVKYHRSQLNLLDVEKKKLIFKTSIRTEEKGKKILYFLEYLLEKEYMDWLISSLDRFHILDRRLSKQWEFAGILW